MSDIAGLTTERIKAILAMAEEMLHELNVRGEGLPDGPGSVSAFYTDLSFGEVAALAKMAMEATELHRLATDRLYMMQAYRNMLGPKALVVAKMWDDSRMHRVHFDWQSAAFEVSGEERAQFILDLEEQLKDAEPVEFIGDEAVALRSQDTRGTK